MWVLVCKLDLTIPGARSRKDRRQVVRSLKERLREKFHTACAEVDDQTSWVRASLGVTACSSEKSHLEEIKQELIRYAANDCGAMLGAVASEICRFTGEADGLRSLDV